MDQDVYWYNPYYSAIYQDSGQDPAVYFAQDSASYPHASGLPEDATLPQGPQREFGRDKQQNRSYAYELKLKL